MRWMDLNFSRPEENLALDEALLNSVETASGDEVLRFWESPVPFVVLGVAQPVATHVHENACCEDGVPIMRRCSAGGCVLQGPGSLNYTLVMRYDIHPDVRTIRGSYCYILNRIAATLAQRGMTVRHCGISDLALNDRKVSGNAQRRRKHAMLHHGTLLYADSAAAMGRYLREPDDRPEYRESRTHDGFVTWLDATPEELRTAIKEAFGVPSDRKPDTPSPWERSEVTRLLAEKYSSNDWHRRR